MVYEMVIGYEIGWNGARGFGCVMTIDTFLEPLNSTSITRDYGCTNPCDIFIRNYTKAEAYSSIHSNHYTIITLKIKIYHSDS
jgi:hypothetical protein